MGWRLRRVRRKDEDIFVKLLIIAIVGSVIYFSTVQTFDIYRYQVAGGLWSSESESSRPRNESMEKLEIFVVPFTHVDPGWLKTFDSYSESTDSILNNMHQFMTKNGNMTFIWAEMVFLERWWSKQNDSVREDVRRLLKSGRLELTSGSWVMTDEANVYYPVSVDNIIEGHQFIHQEIGANI
ncbi:unnamed protein product [Angiostrongylus costaricensis]|uniref:Glyco_hydro_38N domain-containing protein n=1 Tax=Angiostrongylus costaricensis TaxID=334426 RepID=A0A0R3P9R2_ANGCS|nr:unnamed protein product [Angiostrongylus costaricensis]